LQNESAINLPGCRENGRDKTMVTLFGVLKRNCYALPTIEL
jgi:hypothetical protein